MADESYTIERIGLINVSAFLIHRPGAALLVDSGSGGSEQKILETLAQCGLEPDMLRLLILTHAHFDHAGSAGRLRELTGCRVVIHQSEAASLKKGFTPLPSGTRWKAKLLVGIGRTLAARVGRYRGTEPDIAAGESLDLQEYGFPGRVIHTPGHTAGSMVVLMEGGELLAGDTLFGREGKEHFPPFAEALPALLESWQLIRDLPVRTIYPAHGKSFPFSSFLAEFDGAMEKYGGNAGSHSKAG